MDRKTSLEYANAEIRRVLSVCTDTVSASGLVHAFYFHQTCECHICRAMRTGQLEKHVIDNVLAVIDACDHMEADDPLEFLVWEIEIALLNNIKTPQQYARQNETIDSALMSTTVEELTPLFPSYFRYKPLVQIISAYIGGDTFLSIRKHSENRLPGMAQIVLVDYRGRFLRDLSDNFETNREHFSAVLLRQDARITSAIAVHLDGWMSWSVDESRDQTFEPACCPSSNEVQTNGCIWNYSGNRGVSSWKDKLFVATEHHLSVRTGARRDREEEEEEEHVTATTHMTVSQIEMNGIEEKCYELVLSGPDGIVTNKESHLDLEYWDFHVVPKSWLLHNQDHSMLEDVGFCFVLLNRKKKSLHFFHPEFAFPKRNMYLEGICPSIPKGEVRVDFDSNGEWLIAWTIPATNERIFGYRESDLCVFIVNCSGEIISKTTFFPKGDWIDSLIATPNFVYVDVWAGVFLRHDQASQIASGRIEVFSESSDEDGSSDFGCSVSPEWILSEKIRGFLLSPTNLLENTLRWFNSISWRFVFRFPDLAFVVVLPVCKHVARQRARGRLVAYAPLEELV